MLPRSAALWLELGSKVREKGIWWAGDNCALEGFGMEFMVHRFASIGHDIQSLVLSWERIPRDRQDLWFGVWWID